MDTRHNIAKEVLISTQQICDINGKKILDVGCRTGENALAYSRAGAEVYGVDFDEKSLDIAIREGNLSEKNIFKCKLQDLPSDIKGTFDVATVWLFCINFAERDAFFKSLSEVIKPNGVVIVGVADDVFAHGQASIRPWLEKYFNGVSESRGSGWNKYIFRAVGPKLENTLNQHASIPRLGM